MISWFSNGAASAVATKMMIDAGHDVRIIRTETNSEHEDSLRFQADCSKWFGQEVEVLHNGKFHDVNDVVGKTRFLRSSKGARCTTELKKKVRFQLGEYEKIHVFGYTNDSRDFDRAMSLKLRNPEYKMRFPLIEEGITKAACFEIIKEASIDIPEMYKLGFANNNCPGCLKAETAGYWLLTKKYFPEVFQKRMEQENELGYALCRIDKVPVFLRDLEEYLKTRFDVPGQIKLALETSVPGCDFMCGSENEEITQ